MTDNISPRIIEDEMKQAYLDYSMSVLVGRALPDVRDGLKPVHRRVLYTMLETGLLHNKPFKKSANIVGNCMARYHPHGDAAIYDTLVRMAQPFSLRYPLVDGQGNFGSVDGDNAAAMRYCVSGDSLVITQNGLERIDRISNTEKIDLQILSKDKKLNQASRWFDSGDHETITVTTNKGYSITGSKNHPILTLVKDEFGKPAFMWKLLENIKEGDVAVIDRREDGFWPGKEVSLRKYYPETTRIKKTTILPETLDANLAFILGLLVSEGTVSRKKIEFCNSDEELIKEFQDKWKLVFPDSVLHRFERKPSSFGKNNYFRLECHYIHTIDFLRNIGLEPVFSDKKQVPHVLFKSPKNVVSAFLRAYFEGDGSISFSGRMIELSCCSKSKELIRQLQIIFLRFGVDSFRRFDKYKDIFKLYLRGKRNVLRFYKEINFVSERKKKKLELVLLNYKKDCSLTDFVPFISDFFRGIDSSQFIAKNNFDRYDNMGRNYQKVASLVLEKTGTDYSSVFEYFLTYDYLFDPIVKIEASGIKRVYSLKVESSCHSFISNGFISHNTEARLTKIAEEILADIEKDTVDFVPNFDNSTKEPVVLPSKVPNLLINGSSGIAVGMATNIPPHNAAEVIDATMQLIDQPELSISQLIKFIRGPDFPTGAIICGSAGIEHAYTTGRGTITVRAKAEIEEHAGRQRIIVSEIPFQLNKSTLIEEIAGLVRDKRVQGISDLRDESDRDGIRIVFELKKEAIAEVTLNQLFANSRLESTYGLNLVGLINDEPRTLNLKQLIEAFIGHRKIIVRRRTEYELKQAKEREHILFGLIVALDRIDEVINWIKKSRDANTAKDKLMSELAITEIQARSILDMRLQRLASLEQNKIRQEHKEVLELIKELLAILASEQRIIDIIKSELIEMKEKYGDERRTQIVAGVAEEITTEDMIEPEDMVITITHSGYIKRMPLDAYKEQNRGGKGIIAAETKEGDFVEHLFIGNTHSYILFFTDDGNVHWLKVYQLPEASRQSMGKAIVNLLELGEGAKITAAIPVKEFDDSHFLFMATRKGVVKKTNLEEYSRPRKGGIIAINLEDDSLVDVVLTDGKKNILLATRKGFAIKFEEADVRPTGRASTGVRGIRLRQDDEVVDVVIADDAKQLLTITENGYGKCTPLSEYRFTGRGGKGVINIKTSERNGSVVAIRELSAEDDVMLINKNGMMIRIPADGISVVGRNTQGVRLMKLEQGNKVVAAANIVGNTDASKGL